MGNTLNINLAGMLFKIDVKAYDVLSAYLKAINQSLSGTNGDDEAIEDIELRIAELFNSQKGEKDVITLENVESVISIIGAPADFAQYEDNEPTFTTKRKRLYRNPNNKIIAGVCGGLGAYLNIDPVIIRVLFALFTIFFGVGFLVYLIMWIAILPANSEERLRELYGREYGGARNKTSGIGIAANEMVGAAGSVLYAFARVCLIIIGTVFVTIGFVSLLSFLFPFLFKIPETFLSGVSEITLSLLPNFMKFIITPSLYPWITILSLIVIVLPLMALIYWGIKMIFWFKAKDGILSLILFVVWIVSATALGLLILNESISFAKESVSYEQTPMQRTSDTLYIVGRNRISDAELDNMLTFRIGSYCMLIDNEKKELHINPTLVIKKANDDAENITIRKSARGSNATLAFTKAQKIDYNCQITGDTIFIDSYFTIASNRKWACEDVTVSIALAKDKVIKIGESIDKLLRIPTWVGGKRVSYPPKKIGSYIYWTITDDNLRPYQDINK